MPKEAASRWSASSGSRPEPARCPTELRRHQAGLCKTVGGSYPCDTSRFCLCMVRGRHAPARAARSKPHGGRLLFRFPLSVNAPSFRSFCIFSHPIPAAINASRKVRRSARQRKVSASQKARFLKMRRTRSVQATECSGRCGYPPYFICPRSSRDSNASPCPCNCFAAPAFPGDPLPGAGAVRDLLRPLFRSAARRGQSRRPLSRKIPKILPDENEKRD